jgi:hypothetical protein
MKEGAGKANRNGTATRNITTTTPGKVDGVKEAIVEELLVLTSSPVLVAWKCFVTVGEQGSPRQIITHYHSVDSGGLFELPCVPINAMQIDVGGCSRARGRGEDDLYE